MLIAEELLLLALRPDRGTPVITKRNLSIGLAGALVAELMSTGAIGLSDRRLVVAGPPPADPLLAEVHGRLANSRSKSAMKQVAELVGGSWRVLIDRLADQGIVDRRRVRVLLVFRTTRHPVLRPDVRDQIVRRAQAAAAGAGPIDPRTTALLAMCWPCRLLPVVAPDRADRRQAKSRMAAAARQIPAAQIAQKLIARDQAITTATMSANAAGS